MASDGACAVTRIGMVMGMGCTRTVSVQLGIEFADEIQLATAKWLIFI